MKQVIAKWYGMSAADALPMQNAVCDEQFDLQNAPRAHCLVTASWCVTSAMDTRYKNELNGADFTLHGLCATPLN